MLKRMKGLLIIINSILPAVLVIIAVFLLSNILSMAISDTEEKIVAVEKSISEIETVLGDFSDTTKQIEEKSKTAFTSAEEIVNTLTSLQTKLNLVNLPMGSIQIKDVASYPIDIAKITLDKATTPRIPMPSIKIPVIDKHVGIPDVPSVSFDLPSVPGQSILTKTIPGYTIQLPDFPLKNLPDNGFKDISKMGSGFKDVFYITDLISQSVQKLGSLQGKISTLKSTISSLFTLFDKDFSKIFKILFIVLLILGIWFLIQYCRWMISQIKEGLKLLFGKKFTVSVDML